MWNELITETLARRNLYETFWISLRRLLTGFVIAMVVGTIIGLIMGLFRAANAFFHDWTMVLLAMPALAWALFNSLIFGFGDKGPIITVILAGIPFVIVNVREGVRNTPRELFDMARSYQVPRLKTTRHVLFPSLMPFMFAAARYCFSIGWKGLVIAEVFGGQDGAGWTIKFWYDAHRAHGVVGYAAFFVIFAILFERAVFEPISKRTFRWRPNLAGAEIVEEVFDEENTLEDFASVPSSEMIDDNE
jgi:NitT/TauT family transport system permease protein